MKRKRRIILVVICLVLVIGLPLIWLIEGGEHNRTTNNTQSKDESSKTPVDGETGKEGEPAFDKQQFSTTDPNSIWVIVNKHHPFDPKTYVPGDLTAVGGGQYMRTEAAQALSSMLAAAKAAGLTITPASAYRSYNTQVTVYNNEVETNGQAIADSQSARPGYSEHQTGLAVDLAGGGCVIEDCFGTTEQGRWVTANAHKYGLIQRYVDGKQNITGYRTETWHYRYVGRELATEMQRTSIQTLEEFFGSDPAPSYN